MTKIDLQYDLVNYTPASASPVEANFDRTEQHINQEVIERDGTVAMRAQLKLVGDPVAELDAAPKQYVDQVLPIGIVMMFGGSSVPPGGRWAVCNGAELQTATYPALYAVIGTNFGGTSGRFNLPNLVDRVPMGNGGLATLGAKGGSADATLVAHADAGGTHSHSFNINTGVVSADHSHHVPAVNTGPASANHSHATNVGVFYSDPFAPGFGITVNQGSTLPANYTQVGTTDSGADHIHASGAVQSHGISANHTHNVNGGTAAVYSGDTDSRGVAATNANLPPYIGMAFIMRVL